jgi:branched-chain amino acid transport system ATP-binding protein
MAMLDVQEISTYYGHIQALKGVSIEVDQGEIVTLIGSNGAGKTTTLQTISGLLRPRSGSITLNGKVISDKPAHTVAGMGVAQAPEGRRIFNRMSVMENLELGAYTHGKPDPADLDRVFDLFPRLAERRTQKAGTMSGGEQQMLAIGRALMARPKLILMDEPSMGLSPLLVKEVFSIIRQINRDLGVTILLVEQNARMVLQAASYGYIMESGKVVLDGTAAELSDNEDVKKFYLGGGGEERRSFKNLKSYKRRKRWL